MIAIAAAGLATDLQTSEILFYAVKVVGAAYLFCLPSPVRRYFKTCGATVAVLVARGDAYTGRHFSHSVEYGHAHTGRRIDPGEIRVDAGAAVLSTFAVSLKRLGLFGLTLVLALSFSQAMAQAQSAYLLNFAAVGPGWRLATFPQHTMPVTEYSDATESGRAALRMEAQSSYSPLLKTLAPAAAVKQVRWSWRVGQQSSAIDLRSKAGDDTSAKVCMSFVWPDDRVPFFERQLLRLARTRGNPDLPAATLCWVWANTEQPGEMIENPYTRRVRSIVLRNSVQVGSGWLDEQRDVMKDLRLTFGDEWPAGAPEPLATAIFLAADADNTLSHSVAWIAGLRYE